MTYILISIGLGLLLGWASAYNSKVFLAVLFGTPGVVLIGSKFATPFLSVAATAGAGEGDLFSVAGALFNDLPDPAQTAIMLFPAALFGARIMGTIYIVHFKKEKVETKAEKKARISREYNFNFNV